MRFEMSEFLADLPISIDAATIAQAWSVTARLADLHKLSAYDATYLELAIRLDMPLATRDQRLARAARSAGREVLPAD